MFAPPPLAEAERTYRRKSGTAATEKFLQFISLYHGDDDQEIWNECSRLIANCIIHYNACILSDMLKHYESIGDQENADRIKQISPIAWQHINFYGRYEFQRNPEPIDIPAMIQGIIAGGKRYSQQSIDEAA